MTGIDLSSLSGETDTWRQGDGVIARDQHEASPVEEVPIRLTGSFPETGVDGGGSRPRPSVCPADRQVFRFHHYTYGASDPRLRPACT